MYELSEQSKVISGNNNGSFNSSKHCSKHHITSLQNNYTIVYTVYMHRRTLYRFRVQS